MLKITDLSGENMTYTGGRWVISKPYQIKTLWTRVKDAWAVLTGKAEAVTWALKGGE